MDRRKNWLSEFILKKEFEVFTDLEAAFEEMEFLVKETSRTHRIVTRASSPGYLVTDGLVSCNRIVAELNCRNCVGEKEINSKRSKSVSFSRTKNKSGFRRARKVL